MKRNMRKEREKIIIIICNIYINMKAIITYR